METTIPRSLALTKLRMPDIPAKGTERGHVWHRNPNLSAVRYSPIEERMAKERPLLAEGLEKLRSLLGEEKYGSLVAPLQNITQQGKTLLVVAGNHMRRSLLERDCIPHFQKAFDVSRVHVVA